MDNIVFLEFGGFSIYWYGLFAAAAVLLSALLFSCLRKVQGSDFFSGLTIALSCMPAALVCGRIFYCWFAKASFTGGIADILDLSKGGYALYGVLLGVLLVLMGYSRVWKLPFMELLDAAVPAIALAVAIGRFASILSGDDIGFEISKNDPGLFFAIWSEADGAWILWVGFFEGLFAVLTLLAASAVFVMRYILGTAGIRSGNTVLAFMSVYGLSQTMLESMRNDSLFMVTLGFVRISQIISILLALASLVIISVSVCHRQKPRMGQFAAWVLSIAALSAAVWCEVKMSAILMAQNYTIMGISMAVMLGATAYLYYGSVCLYRDIPETDVQKAVPESDPVGDEAEESMGVSFEDKDTREQNRISVGSSRQREPETWRVPVRNGGEESRLGFSARSPQRDAESWRQSSGRMGEEETVGFRERIPQPDPEPVRQPARRGGFTRHSPQRREEIQASSQPVKEDIPLPSTQGEAEPIRPAQGGSRFSRHTVHHS